MPIITIGGAAGTGTSTLGKALSKELGFAYLSGGDIMRKHARNHGMDIADFTEFCAMHPKFDMDLDKKQAELCPELSLILESRMGWRFAPKALSVLLTCADTVRLMRIAKRDGVSIQRAHAFESCRHAADINRYYYLHGVVNYLDPRYYDVVIDTGSVPESETVEIVMGRLNDIIPKKIPLLSAA